MEEISSRKGKHYCHCCLSGPITAGTWTNDELVNWGISGNFLLSHLYPVIVWKLSEKETKGKKRDDEALHKQEKVSVSQRLRPPGGSLWVLCATLQHTPGRTARLSSAEPTASSPLLDAKHLKYTLGKALPAQPLQEGVR